MTDKADNQRLVLLAERLSKHHQGLDGERLLRPLIRQEFAGSVALMSSFGAESVILLHMVADIDPHTPVFFFDTGKLFDETYAYSVEVIALLGLTDVRVIKPDTTTLATLDPDGDLHAQDPGQCCYIRKVEPWIKVRDQSGITAWITGRKRIHGADRATLPLIEAEEGIIKINPLVPWSAARIDTYFQQHNLPEHPSKAKGYLSIGCVPCTVPTIDGKDPRSGRWSGLDKTECGLHQAR